LISLGIADLEREEFNWRSKNRKDREETKFDFPTTTTTTSSPWGSLVPRKKVIFSNTIFLS
jgi:hypothetical protein